MTEFKAAEKAAADLSAQLARIQDLASNLSAPARHAALQQIEADIQTLQPKMQKFSKRLTEVDPVTGSLRYGEGMRQKVRPAGSRAKPHQ